MEQSPSWEANRFSASQEIPHILWNPNVHYLIHKCPPTIPEPARSSPCHQIQLLKIYLNIILPSMPGSSKWSLSLRFSHLCFPPYVLYAPPSHSSRITFYAIVLLNNCCALHTLCSFTYMLVLAPTRFGVY